MAATTQPAVTTTGPAPTTTTTSVPPTTASSPAAAHGIAKTSFPFVDRSRPAVSRGRLIAPYRSLTTTVWYPQGAAKPEPLLVFAHGYRVGVAPYARACEMWARRGFVVAAPTFPLTDQAVAGPALDEQDMVNQPGDVSFVLTQLIGLSARPGSSLSGLINAAQVAVVGHSDGADTALAVGYLPSQMDRRIGAVIADAPDPLPLPSTAPRLTSTVPLLLIHGDRDSIAPFAGSQKVTTQVSVPGWFLVLRGADHLPPIEGPSAWTPTFDQVTTDFLTGVFGAAATLSQQLAADVRGAPASLLALTK